MDWKEIETKWAEMARRIRADAVCGETIGRAASDYHAAKREPTRTIVAKPLKVVGTELPREPVTASPR